MARPPKFKSAKDIESAAQKYFDSARENKEPITVTGLCIALDTTRESLCDYGSGKYDERDSSFSDTVKRVKLICENYAELRLYGNNPTGAIFALKNFGWSDKVQNEVTGANGGPLEASITVNFVKPAQKAEKK
jgi:hypothetical protein